MRVYVCLSVYLFICLSICLSVCQSACLVINWIYITMAVLVVQGLLVAVKRIDRSFTPSKPLLLECKKVGWVGNQRRGESRGMYLNFE